MEVLVENRRQFFRIGLNIDMCASISILSANGVIINSNRNFICVKDISAGGLRFGCKLDLPTGTNIVYNLEFSIDNIEYTYKANIVRKDIQKDGTFMYGSRFKIDEIERDKLITILNNFTITYKKTVNPSYVQCNKRKCPYKNQL